MKFLITRTSLFWDDDEKPCGEDGLKKVKYLSDKGNEYEGWLLNIDNLEELINFQNNYGDIIISDGVNKKLKEIEIYDSWRE